MAEEKQPEISSLDTCRLKHFLYMGDEGSRYIPPFLTVNKPFCIEKVNSITTLLAEKKGINVVQEIINVCQEHKTISMDAVIFTLALCSTCDDQATKAEAYKAVPLICIEAESLFAFISYVEQIRSPETGWGRGLRRAVSQWYSAQKLENLAVLVTKCISSKGWRHKDLIKLSHLKPENNGILAITKYLMKGIQGLNEVCEKDIDGTKAFAKYIQSLHELKHTTDAQAAARIIDSVDEIYLSHVPSHLLKSKEVWNSLIRRLPISVLLKQIHRFRRLGYLKQNNTVMNFLLEQLVQDTFILSDSNLDPVSVYLILKKYEMQGKSICMPHNKAAVAKHKPNPKLLESLYYVFYSSFKMLRPTGKRFLIAVDVRHPMTHNKVLGNPVLTPAIASALLIMNLVRQDNSLVTAVAFCSRGLKTLSVNNKMTLNDITKRMKETAMGSVNLAEPMQWAAEKKKHIDMFIVCTDTQAFPGDLHPAEALKEYRKSMNLPNTKFVTCSMSTSNVSIAPPGEPGMLDLIGFDCNTPRIIRDFVTDVF